MSAKLARWLSGALLLALALGAIGCGRYGPPRRPDKPLPGAPPAASQPGSDPDSEDDEERRSRDPSR